MEDLPVAAVAVKADDGGFRFWAHLWLACVLLGITGGGVNGLEIGEL